MRSLSEESRLAGRIKKEEPILVILGNPPYSGISANASERLFEVRKGQKYIAGYTIVAHEKDSRKRYSLLPQESVAKKNMRIKQKTWIGELIEHYKIVDGRWFGERKHWLQDDYVKFIRFAQWKIDGRGEGVVGFITNHSYLDNPTFRGMRQSLMNSFDEIDILDLHGNSLKREKAPDGSKDENVFDIQQGVAIVLLVKHKKRTKDCIVRHAEVWGSREKKYEFLASQDFRGVKKTNLRPSPPFYFFVPTAEKHKAKWDGFAKIVDVFPVNVTGIVTARDGFVIDFDKSALKNRIMQFRNLIVDDDFIRLTFKLKDTRGWKMSAARKILAKDTNWDAYFAPILYRPFDIRWIYYTPTMVDWGRPEVMRNMMQPNISLITPRQFKEQSGALVTNYMLVTKQSALSTSTIFSLSISIPTQKSEISSRNRSPRRECRTSLQRYSRR